MEVEIDHYEILGLPTGEEGSKLTQTEIKKAYRSKALQLHPDKNRNDPNADANFTQLKSSFNILQDEKARKLFDDLLRVKLERRQRQSQHDSKRRKMMSDLDERERASFSSDPFFNKDKQEEERIAKEFREEIERIRAMQANKSRFNVGTPRSYSEDKVESESEGLDGAKVLKVSWDGSADDYTSTRLRELFEEFGEVEDVVIQSGRKMKRTNTALVVMATKDAAVSAMGTVCGDLSNPLLVMPLLKTAPTTFSSPFPTRHVEPDPPVRNNLVGAKYQAREDSIIEKMRKAAEKQKC